MGLLKLRPVYSLSDTVFNSPPIGINAGQFVATYPMKFIMSQTYKILLNKNTTIFGQQSLCKQKEIYFDLGIVILRLTIILNKTNNLRIN